jgi:hypothetical protein
MLTAKFALARVATIHAFVLLFLVAEDVPGQPKGTIMRDVWNHKDVTITDGKIPLSLNTHDSVLAVLEHASG